MTVLHRLIDLHWSKILKETGLAWHHSQMRMDEWRQMFLFHMKTGKKLAV